MTVTIEKDGWKVSATTLAELEIGIAAVQKALSRAGASHGHPAPGSTAQAEATIQRTARSRRRGDSRRASTRTKSLQILEAIAAAGARGLDAADMAEMIGAPGLKGLGTPVAVLNKLLAAAGIPEREAYEKQIDLKKRMKVYFPGPRIAEAISVIKRIEE